MLFVLVTQFIGHMQMFGQAYSMTAGGPGYDSSQQPDAGAGDGFVTTAAFSRPADSGDPAVGESISDPEDKKPGHL